MFESIEVLFEVLSCWFTIFLRIGFIAFTGYLIYSIVWSLRFLKTNRSKKLKIKLGVLSVVLCVCILLGYTEPPAKIRVKMDTVSDTFNYVKQLFHGKLIEEVYIICFTPKNKIIAVEKIAEGTISTVDAPIRKISDKLSRLKCSNIILAHNHPGGKVEPSEDDHRFTKAIVTTLALTGSHLMDHIIVGEGDEYYSYRRSGLIDEYKNSIKDLLVGKVAQPQAKYEVD